ncbi:unnamed protein product [Brassica oleracea var. botrytis]
MYVPSTKEVVATMILSNDGCFVDDGATTENTLRSKRKISKERLGGVLGQFVCKRTKEVYMPASQILDYSIVYKDEDSLVLSNLSYSQRSVCAPKPT